MRRIAILVFVLLGAIAIACAEEIDLNSYSVDELINLKIAVDQELIERNRTDLSYLFPGTYVVGEDIEPGRYSLRCIRVSKKHVSGVVGLFYSIDDEKPYEQYVLRPPTDECSVRLVEGRVLKTQSATCVIAKE